MTGDLFGFAAQRSTVKGAILGDATRSALAPASYATGSTASARRHKRHTGSGSAPPTSTAMMRATTRHLAHPVVHVGDLLTAHVAALAVLEKTPLLALLSLH